MKIKPSSRSVQNIDERIFFKEPMGKTPGWFRWVILALIVILLTGVLTTLFLGDRRMVDRSRQEPVVPALTPVEDLDKQVILPETLETKWERVKNELEGLDSQQKDFQPPNLDLDVHL